MNVQPEKGINNQSRLEKRITDGVIGTAQLLLDESPNTREIGMLGMTKRSTFFTQQHASYVQIGDFPPTRFSRIDIVTGLTRPGEEVRSATIVFGETEAELSNPTVVEVSHGELLVRDAEDVEGDYSFTLDAGAAEVFLGSFDDLATGLL